MVHLHKVHDLSENYIECHKPIIYVFTFVDFEEVWLCETGNHFNSYHELANRCITRLIQNFHDNSTAVIRLHRWKRSTSAKELTKEIHDHETFHKFWTHYQEALLDHLKNKHKWRKLKLMKVCNIFSISETRQKLQEMLADLKRERLKVSPKTKKSQMFNNNAQRKSLTFSV